jgi:hypothetical protein
MVDAEPFSVLDQATGVSDSEPVPAGFALQQNYPNPFNPSTKISYSIPAQTRVEIKVFDIIGNEVEVLINEVQAAGHHSVSFDAATLSSGVYVYRLKAGEFTALKKMLLIH